MTLRSLAPALLLSLLLPTGLAAQTPAEIIENFKPDRHVWHLEVTIDRQGSAHEEMRSDDGGVTRSSNREVNDTVTVHACGQAGLWAVSGLGEKITFEKDAGGALSGSKTLGKTEAKNPGDYQETTTANWRLEPADPCEEVRAMMVQDLAWAEAYLDRALQQAAGNSTAKMKELVNRRIAEQSGWKPESGNPPPQAETNMFVNEKCEIEGEDDFRMENRNACKPLILTEAVMAHERRHVEQCSKQREEEPGTSWEAPSPTRYGNNEAGGYLTGVSRALSWYEDNCPGETASIRKRWKAIALEAATRQLH